MRGLYGLGKVELEVACGQARIKDDADSQHPFRNRFDGATDGLGNRIGALGDVVVYVFAQLGQELSAIALVAIVLLKLGNRWGRQLGQTSIDKLGFTFGQNPGLTLNGQRFTLGELCLRGLQRKLQFRDDVLSPHVPVLGHILHGSHGHIVDQAFAVQLAGVLNHLTFFGVRVKVVVVELVNGFIDGL